MRKLSGSFGNIKTINYKFKTRILEIEFHNGEFFRHHGVPQHLYNEFNFSNSKEHFYNIYIRDYYPFQSF